jgi:Phosphotransferase enzyme family
MDDRLRGIVARVLGSGPRRWRAVRGGYTHNERWVVELAGGRSAFVKAAVDELSAGWLRDEHSIYESVRGSFLPDLLGWEAGELPVLVLEDLSGARWPPPWTPEGIDSVRAALDELAGTPPPEGLGSLEELREMLAGWPEVERDPLPFLRLGLCTPAWLEASLPDLRAAEETCVLAGDAFLHFDVRSDNLCLRAQRAILVDWNWAVRGNPVMDVAAWLPSLEAEGGPAPEAILPGKPEAAALIAGFFAARAGVPPPRTAPGVREVQLAQLRSALPWAARELGLPPPIAP